MNSIVDTYDLRDQFRTGHEVIDARWDDGTSQWAVTVKSPNAVFEDRCDFLVNGSGILKFVEAWIDWANATVTGNGQTSKALRHTKAI